MFSTLLLCSFGGDAPAAAIPHDRYTGLLYMVQRLRLSTLRAFLSHLAEQVWQSEVCKNKLGDVMRFSLFPATLPREEGVV